MHRDREVGDRKIEVMHQNLYDSKHLAAKDLIATINKAVKSMEICVGKSL